MITFDEQLELFKLIGKDLNNKVTCFAIGGNAMMFYGAKEETKDIDLVFLNKKDLEEVKKVLYNSGFEDKKDLIKIFRHHEVIEKENMPVMMVMKEERIDLFVKGVITFEISDTIDKRVKETHEFDNLIVKVVSPEDIILMKSATERKKDKIDALSLIEKFNINWDIIVEESINQTKLERELFPVFLYDFLTELKEDLKADIPKEVINKVRDIGKAMMIKRLKKGK